MKLTNNQIKVAKALKGNYLVNSGGGSGKALLHGTNVQTPTGPVPIESLNVGDDVFGTDGKVYKVEGVYPQGKKRIWDVVFSDGNIVKCCEEHLWTYQTAKERHNKNQDRWRTHTTRYIKENAKFKVSNGGHNVYVPMSDSVMYPKRRFNIHPYLIGALIGDGSLHERGIRFTNSEIDVVEKVNKHLSKIGSKLALNSKNSDKTNEFIVIIEDENLTRSVLTKEIKAMGLAGCRSYEKFIPKKYLYSSTEQRTDLLRGLMDTDGYIQTSTTEFSTSSKQLSEDVRFLAESLGLTATVSTKKEPTYVYKGEKLKGRDSYRVVIKTSDKIPHIFSSEKHSKNWKRGQTVARRTIREINETDSYGEMTCISVSSPNKLFLIDNFIPTHNTSSFTARIANLIANEKVAPQQILGLTFTNEAAESMKAKLREKVGKKADRVELSTFHSFAYRTLKSTYPEEYANKEIMKPWWKLNQIYDIIGKPSSKNPDGLGLEVRAGDLIGFFSYQKANMVRDGDRVLIDEAVSYVDHISEYFLQKAYDMYCERVKDARVIDFDDMLVDFYYKLLEDNELLERLRNRFEYIMVDEFQDTNTVNMAILQLISEDNLLVVGDFRQGIYGFINANIDNILEFHKNFNNVETIELEENFRSTNNIIQICNDVIDSSPNTKYKAFSEQKQGRNTPGKPINVRVFSDETEETSHIVDEIERIYEENDLNYADFAILCRTNAQLGLYESFLANKGIPAKLSGGRSFFDRKEVSDLLAYAQHAINPEDNMSIRQIFNAPVRYIANTAINGLEKYSSQYDMPLEEAIGYYDADRYTSGFKRVVQDFESIRRHTGKRADVVLKKIYSIVNYENFIYSKSMSHTELVTKEEAVERLFDMASKFNTIQHFLAHVSVIKSNSKKDEDAVNVMTVHASKGLEYEHVFVAGVSEENYPHKMSTDYEEERRLLYVALSRAINELHISIPIFKGEDGEVFEPSPFLIDIMEDDLFKAKREVIRGSRCSEFLYNSKRKKD